MSNLKFSNVVDQITEGIKGDLNRRGKRAILKMYRKLERSAKTDEDRSALEQIRTTMKENEIDC